MIAPTGNFTASRHQVESTVNLEFAINEWIDEKAICRKASTTAKYRYMSAMHIIPYIGHIKLSDINARTVNDFIAEKRASGRLDGGGGLAASYINTMNVIIRASLDYAVQKGMCAPLDGVIYRSKAAKPEIPILSKSDIARLEAYLTNNMDQTSLGLLLSLYMGLRLGEVCALRWDDIDCERKILHVRGTTTRVFDLSRSGERRTLWIVGKPKTLASNRRIPIPSKLMPCIQAQQAAASSPYVVSGKESFVNPRTYEYRFHRILNKAGLTQTNYHALRHTFATMCVAAGMDVKSLSEILGHGSAAITLNIYVHPSLEMKRNQLDKAIEF